MVNMSAPNLLPPATANHSPLPQAQRTPLRTDTKPVFQACDAQQMISKSRPLRRQGPSSKPFTEAVVLYARNSLSGRLGWSRWGTPRRRCRGVRNFAGAFDLA